MALLAKKSKQMFEILISSLLTPPGDPEGSTDPGETKEFDILGFRCDHEVLKQ